MDTETQASCQDWQPIQDLPIDWEMLREPDVESFARVWDEESVRLKSTDALIEFNKRLAREWSIETGILEGLYDIDRGITLVLIEKGIEASLIPHGSTDRPVEEVYQLLRDQQDTLDGIFDFVASRRPLTPSYIKELHASLTRHQLTSTGMDQMGHLRQIPLVRGDWKILPNNPTRPDGIVHCYSPPEHVAAETDRLVSMHAAHVDQGVPPEIEAAWLHHRFTQIHPFQDGNGRVARALASLIFLRANWFPLVIDRDMRGDYIAALERADGGDIGPLVAQFSAAQNKAMRQAFSISAHVLRTQDSMRQLIAAAADRLSARRAAEYAEREAVFGIARTLEARAFDHLHRIAADIESTLGGAGSAVSALVDRSMETNDHWFRKQILEIAKKSDYYADTRTYKSWVRLRIREERQTEIVIAFHSLGFEFVGVLVASAFVEHRDRTEAGDVVVDGPYPLAVNVFQFVYNEQPQEVTHRFEAWLDDVLLVGLDHWRRQL
jgi:Fic family protein